MAGLYSFELCTWLKLLFFPSLLFNLLLHLQRSIMSEFSLGFPLTCPIWCVNTASPVSPQSASSSCSLLLFLQCRNSWESCAQQTCEISPGLSMSSGHYSLSAFLEISVLHLPFSSFCPVWLQKLSDKSQLRGLAPDTACIHRSPSMLVFIWQDS